MGLAQAQSRPPTHPTEELLKALLSLPQVQPQTDPRPEPPQGFDPQEGEAGLIRYLAKQKRGGADLNAYANLGTPLLHAIQSGQSKLAQWLLKQGANPLLRVREPGADGPEGPDALSLAVRVQDLKLAALLRAHPAYARLPAGALAQRVWPYAASAQWGELRAAGWPLPEADSPGFGRLLQRSLCARRLDLAQALMSAPGPAGAGRPPRGSRKVAKPHFLESQLGSAPAAGILQGWTSVCPDKVPAEANRPATLAAWRALEAQLQVPLLANWAGQLSSAAEWDAALRAGLQPPWRDAARTRALLGALRGLSLPAALALAHQLPSAPLQAVLEEEEAMGQWLSAAQHWPLAELRWALGQVKPHRLGAHLPTLLASHWFPAGAEAEARWQALTERLVAPIPAQAVQPGRVPVALLSRWLALGLRPSTAGWQRWLREQAEVGAFDVLWPATAAHAPKLARSALDGLLVPLLANPIGAVEEQTGLGGLEGDAADARLLSKLRWAQARGLRPSRIGWLRADQAAGTSESVRFALAQGWVQRAPEALRRQVARAPQPCGGTPPPRAALLRLLATPHSESRPNSYVDQVQSLTVAPGRCAWLLTGGTPWMGMQWEEWSFADGRSDMRANLADGDRQAHFWAPGAAAPQALGEALVGPLVAVRLPGSTEQALWVELEHDSAGGGSLPGQLWILARGERGEPNLLPAPTEHPARVALLLQCDVRALSACLGLAPETLDGPEAPQSVDAFVQAHYAAARVQFLELLARNDREGLKAFKAEGLVPAWLDEGLVHIGGLALPLQDRRQRTAWVLAQREPAAPLSESTLASLRIWLPAQDWTPIIHRLRCTPSAPLQALSQQSDLPRPLAHPPAQGFGDALPVIRARSAALTPAGWPPGPNPGNCRAGWADGCSDAAATGAAASAARPRQRAGHSLRRRRPPGRPGRRPGSTTVRPSRRPPGPPGRRRNRTCRPACRPVHPRRGSWA